MQLNHSLGVALCLVLGLFSPAQDEKKPDESKPRKPPTEAQLELQQLRTDLQGAWRLAHATTAGEEFSGAECGGVMLVMDEYMSITARFRARQPITTSGAGEFFASGAYRWHYDEDRLVLVTSTLLGMDNFGGGDGWGYQPGGERREYQIDLAGDALTLTRDGGRRFEFTRMSPPPRRSETPTKH